MLRLLPGVAAVAIALALAGCGADEPADESRIVGDTLTVYSSLPHHGPLEPVSRDLVRAQKLALDEAGGRAGDFRVSFVSLDSADPQTERWSPERVAENARTAVRDLQTIAYIGELEPGASTVSVPILNAGGMLQVSPRDTFAGLTERGAPGEPEKYYPSGRRTFARMVPPDSAQVDALLGHLRRSGVRRASLADDRQVAGTALIDALSRRLRAAGIEVVDRKRLDPDGDVPDDLGEDVLEARADAFVYGGGYGRFAMQALRAVHDASPRTALFAPDGMTLAPGLPRAAGDTAEQLLVLGVAPRAGAQGRAFARRFRARYGTDPDRQAILGYQAMRLVLRAIERAGPAANRRPAVIREALALAGEPRAAFAAFRIERDRVVRVGPPV